MAGLPFLDKFKKEVAKLDTVAVGLPETTHWLSTGNFALNRALSGDFKKGVPLAKITLFAGPSGCLPLTETISVYEFRTDPGLSPKVERE